MLRDFSLAAILFTCGVLAVGCGSPAPITDASNVAPAAAWPAALPAPAADPTSTPPVQTSAPASESPSNAGAQQPASPAASSPDAEQTALAARASGPATGGPRGARPCEFHESVDTYQRRCVASVNEDGSVSVVAHGTKLNPDNGFDFTMHGAESDWAAKGTLNAFKQCAGPFVAKVTTYVDKGVKTYELRFKDNCMIVVR